MKKQTIHRFDNDYFLIGLREDDVKVYLQDFSWDCGWYWAGGYLTVLGRNDINEHYHLDSLMVSTNLYDGIKHHFKEIVLDSNELWKFCELMASFYALRESAEVIGRGGSHYSSPMLTPSKELAEHINNNLIKNQLIPLVRELLK